VKRMHCLPNLISDATAREIAGAANWPEELQSPSLHCSDVSQSAADRDGACDFKRGQRTSHKLGGAWRRLQCAAAAKYHPRVRQCKVWEAACRSQLKPVELQVSGWFASRSRSGKSTA